MIQIVIMVAQRFALGLLTLFAVSLIIFLGVELLPGDKSARLSWARERPRKRSPRFAESSG